MKTINEKNLKIMLNTLLNKYAINYDRYPAAGYTYLDDDSIYVFTDNLFNYIYSIKTDEDVDILNTLTTNFTNYLFPISTLFSVFKDQIFSTETIITFNNMVNFVNSTQLNQMIDDMKQNYLYIPKRYTFDNVIHERSLADIISTVTDSVLINSDKYSTSSYKCSYKPIVDLDFSTTKHNDKFNNIFDAYKEYRNIIVKKNSLSELSKEFTNQEIANAYTRMFNTNNPYFIKDVYLYRPKVLDIITGSPNIDKITINGLSGRNKILKYAKELVHRQEYINVLDKFILDIRRIVLMYDSQSLNSMYEDVNLSILYDIMKAHDSYTVTTDTSGNKTVSINGVNRKIVTVNNVEYVELDNDIYIRLDSYNDTSLISPIFNFNNIKTVNDINSSNVFTLLIYGLIFDEMYKIPINGTTNYRYNFMENNYPNVYNSIGLYFDELCLLKKHVDYVIDTLKEHEKFE